MNSWCIAFMVFSTCLINCEPHILHKQYSRKIFFQHTAATFTAATVVVPTMVSLLPRSVSAAALPSPEEAVATLESARTTLAFLLTNWEKTVIDCSTADVSRDLLETQNKEQLLEKAKTFALFDKDAAVLSCKESNSKVRTFITRLKRLDGQFSGAKLVVIDKEGDIERYFDLVDRYNNALSAANSASYTASMDFSSLNANKMDTSLNKEDQQLSGGSDNMDNTKIELRTALEAITEITEMLK
ncbi:hypothetical protein TrRE_jg3672 [Triparma retinervis]|uniref:Uncharacterized protein n=1 Tax=Triparma retinervis TaxID=2557542 RepID=A0A9W7DNL5_9STRA|nr:hypothetical protein TrRE_jg3672 [Triparma retinervis]